jgi:hypothetical protein
MVRKGATIPGYLIQEMAGVFWDKLEQYAHEEKPQFSGGWLSLAHSFQIKVQYHSKDETR